MAYSPIPQVNEDTAFTNGDPGIPMYGVRQDADTSPVSADGDYHALQFNSVGRLKVATMPGDYSPITGSITAIQATIGTPVAGGTVIADISRASNVNMYCTGTFAGVNVTFEGCLEATGENWFGIQAVRTNANTVELTTGVLSAAPAYAWELSVNALSRIRVRCTARTSGTQNWIILPGSYATEPIPAAQVTATQPVSGTVSVTTTSVGASASAVGQTIYRDMAATNTDQAIKATTNARLYSYYLYNPDASINAWVHFYNATTATVVVGTTVPAYSVYVPAGGTAEREFMAPLAFATALTVAATTSRDYTVTAAPTTALVVEVGYI